MLEINRHRMIEARKAKGLRQHQLAKKVGVEQQAISDIETGKTKVPGYIDKIAKELGVSQSWLLGDADSPDSSTPNLYRHPIPVLEINEAEPWLENPILKPTHRVINMHSSEKHVSNLLFFIKIHDDSMLSFADINSSYLPGYLALIDPSKGPEIGRGVLVKIGKELKIRVYAQDGTELILAALNPKYPNIKITDEVKILGIVRTLMKDFDFH